MRRQAGVAILLYLGLALAILIAFGAIGRAIFNAGVEHEQAAQAERDRAAQARARENDLILREQAREASLRLLAANQEARNYETKWKHARRSLRDSALAVCPAADALQPPYTASTPEVASPTPPGGLRLTYGFLRLYDGAWTGEQGQPVFGDPGGPPEGAPPAGAPSARGLGDALEAHAENARRCSENSRQLKRLAETVKALRAKWRDANPD